MAKFSIKVQGPKIPEEGVTFSLEVDKESPVAKITTDGPERLLRKVYKTEGPFGHKIGEETSPRLLLQVLTEPQALGGITSADIIEGGELQSLDYPNAPANTLS